MAATAIKGKGVIAKRTARRLAAERSPQSKARAEYASSAPGRFIDKNQVDFKSLALEERRALLKASFGSLSWLNYSVDEYLAEKRAETKRENRI